MSYDIASNPPDAAMVDALFKGYREMRARAEADGSGVDLAIVYDPIGNAEESSPFGYCPIPAVPVLHRFGLVVDFVNAK